MHATEVIESYIDDTVQETADNMVKIGLLVWLGLVVVAFAAENWIRRRWPATVLWEPRDRDLRAECGRTTLRRDRAARPRCRCEEGLIVHTRSHILPQAADMQVTLGHAVYPPCRRRFSRLKW
jgi:hypothetical protein